MLQNNYKSLHSINSLTTLGNICVEGENGKEGY
jgi:hypothetical protein